MTHKELAKLTQGKSLSDLEAMRDAVGNALKRFEDAGNTEQILTYGRVKTAYEQAIAKAKRMRHDHKQADGHVILTKAGYVAWLKAHRDEIVGSVGTSTRFTPISEYALSLGLVFGEQSMPVWARNLRDRYEAVAMSGRVRGSQAISEVLEALGYDVYVKFYATTED